MKRFRLSSKQVEAVIADWNKERNLKYMDQGFLMLQNDGPNYFLTQISRQGSTAVDGIATHGKLRDCLDAIWQAKEPKDYQENK